MSKSLGNFLTARAALEKYPPLALRFFMLSAHYRSPINFAPSGLEQAASGVTRLRNCRSDLDFAAKNRQSAASDLDWAAFEAEMKRMEERFVLNDAFLPLLVKTSIPTIIGMLVMAIYNLTDTFFVGILNNKSMTAAIGIVFSFMSLRKARKNPEREPEQV